MYDEVAAVSGKNGSWSHSILLSNGWELRLRLSEVEVVRTEAVYPSPETMLVPVSTAGVPRSA
jgi:hypothetical protein